VTGAAVGTAPGVPVAAVHPAARTSRLVLAALVLLTGVTLLLGYENKARCAGPEFDQTGRSAPDYGVRIERDVCYSDIQHLWIGRDIDRHVFPYVSGSITPEGQLLGGSVEYPVLTGLLIWGGALFADTDAGFLLGSALLMAPFGLVTGWLLGRLARWRALLWALGPPLVLYAFHNWDLPVVACAVAAVFAVHGWRTDRTLAQRGTVAGVLLGLGFAFKLYPGAFVLPLALYVLVASQPGRLDWRAAVRGPLAAAATVVLVNVPFMVAGYEGWRASFTFQQLRKVDFTTNSIWFWGFRPESDPDNVDFQSTMDWLSPALRWAGGGTAARASTRGSGCPLRCCAASCCCTRSTHRSTRCGSCRSSSSCGCPGRSSVPTSSRTSRWGSASSAGTTSSMPASRPASTTASPRRRSPSACGAGRRCSSRCSSCSCASPTGSRRWCRRGARRWPSRWADHRYPALDEAAPKHPIVAAPRW
jgi:hypothetical protein